MADTDLFLGKAEEAQFLRLDRANRHGVVAGATGTGKTVTLQIMAQGFSDAGVPVFCADVKGDLSGICVAGTPNEKLLARAQTIGLDLQSAAAPTVFWDLFGEKGHPVRATVSEVGPLLLARMLELSDVQTDVLSVVFHVADKEGLLLLDLDDLRALLTHVAENAAEIGKTYGHVAPASIAAIQRSLLALERQGAGAFFGTIVTPPERETVGTTPASPMRLRTSAVCATPSAAVGSSRITTRGSPMRERAIATV